MAEEINLDKRIPIKNLCTWDIYFFSVDGRDIKIPASGRLPLTRNEIISQVENGNTFLAGDDGKGSHAKLFIDDKETRIYLQFESEDGKETQNILTEDIIKEILDIKTIPAFKKRLEKDVLTNGEKALLVEVAKKTKLNDFKKIQTIEEYTGLKFEVEEK